jgi:hypothetical protein
LIDDSSLPQLEPSPAGDLAKPKRADVEFFRWPANLIETIV